MFNKVSFLDKVLFTKHLAIMLRAGISITDALDTLKEQTNSKAFRKVIDVILQDTINGQALAKSLGKHPQVFDTFYLSLIRVGEESGTLEENLAYLSEQLSKDFELRQKVRSAMLYPAIVLGATAVLGAFVAYFILPKLVDFFKSFKVELPLPTKILLFAATFVKNYNILILVSLVGVALGFSFFIKLKPIRPFWHQFLLKVPIFGRLNKNLQIARFSRNLGVLLKSGVPISQALDVTAKTLGNIGYQQAVSKALLAVDKGKPLSEALSKQTFSARGGLSNSVDKLFTFNFFPPLVLRMLGVGEKTGSLDETLLYLANYYDDEIDTQTKNLATTLEPMLLLVIGLIVGFVAVSIISPIYQLTGSIRR